MNSSETFTADPEDRSLRPAEGTTHRSSARVTARDGALLIGDVSDGHQAADVQLVLPVDHHLVPFAQATIDDGHIVMAIPQCAGPGLDGGVALDPVNEGALWTALNGHGGNHQSAFVGGQQHTG